MIRWVLRLAPLPAVLLATLVAVRTGVPVRAFAPNFVGLIFGCVWLGTVDRFRNDLRKRSFAISVAILISLVSTLLFEGVSGVHRWMWLGPISLNVSMALLPILVFSIYEILDASTARTLAVVSATAAIHTVQPDLGQSIVFCTSMIAVVLAKPFARPLVRPFAMLLPRMLCVLIPVVATVATGFQSDQLAPVEHVEKIFSLIAGQGLPEIIELIFAAAILFTPFWYFASNASEETASFEFRRAVVATTYLSSALLTPFIGNFPTPLFGAGLAGVLGWYGLVVFTRPRPA